MTTTSPLSSAVDGVAGGSIATLFMSAAMAGAQRAGLLGEMPPTKIVDRAASALGRRPRGKERRLATALAHIGFGAATGAGFGLAYRATRGLLPAPLQGVLFGLAVWGVSYAGWVPALGIMPMPKNDRPGRPTSMILSHVVFGAVLGAYVEQKALQAEKTSPSETTGLG